MKNFFAAALISLITFFGFSGCNKTIESNSGAEFYEVTKVSDGDTFEVFRYGKKEKIRLIGVDTPETKLNEKNYKLSKKHDINVDSLVRWGKNASSFLKQTLAPGTKVRLEFDKDSTDQYKRTLAYAYFQDGRMINRVIAESGYCFAVFYSPNYKYRSELEKAVENAKEKGLGIWSVKDGFKKKMKYE